MNVKTCSKHASSCPKERVGRTPLEMKDSRREFQCDSETEDESCEFTSIVGPLDASDAESTASPLVCRSRRRGPKYADGREKLKAMKRFVKGRETCRKQEDNNLNWEIIVPEFDEAMHQLDYNFGEMTSKMLALVGQQETQCFNVGGWMRKRMVGLEKLGVATAHATNMKRIETAILRYNKNLC